MFAVPRKDDSDDTELSDGDASVLLLSLFFPFSLRVPFVCARLRPRSLASFPLPPLLLLRFGDPFASLDAYPPS